MEQLKIKLDAFEGPLDLLIHLIEKSKIDIYDIPIAQLTEQYMDYLDAFSNRSMDSISEFLVMAATLLEIKSKMLLPSVEKQIDEDIDPREELVNKLIEYKRFKRITETLKAQETVGEKYFYKEPEEMIINMLKSEVPLNLDDVLQGITLEKLFVIFDETLRRRELKTDKIRSSFNSIQRDLFTIEDKMEYISDLLVLHDTIIFSRIFMECSGKPEKVVTFLALLELIKLKRIKIKQENIFDEILVYQYQN